MHHGYVHSDNFDEYNLGWNPPHFAKGGARQMSVVMLCRFFYSNAWNAYKA